MAKYRKITDAVWKILAYVLAAMLGALVVIVFWQILCRYVFRASNGWTQEISTLLFVWSTFLGAVLAIKSGSQIAMKIAVNKMPQVPRIVFSVIAACICEGFYLLLSMAGFKAMEIFMNATTPALRISMVVPYGAIAFSGIAMMFFGIEEIAKPILEDRGKNTEQKEDETV